MTKTHSEHFLSDLYILIWLRYFKVWSGREENLLSAHTKARDGSDPLKVKLVIAYLITSMMMTVITTPAIF